MGKDFPEEKVVNSVKLEEKSKTDIFISFHNSNDVIIEFLDIITTSGAFECSRYESFTSIYFISPPPFLKTWPTRL